MKIAYQVTVLTIAMDGTASHDVPPKAVQLGILNSTCSKFQPRVMSVLVGFFVCLIYVYVCMPAYLYLYYMYTMLRGARRGIRSLETRVSSGCEPVSITRVLCKSCKCS